MTEKWPSKVVLAGRRRYPLDGRHRAARMIGEKMNSEDQAFRLWHLATTEFGCKFSDFDWALMRLYEAFTRFVSSAGATTVSPDLKIAEHLIIHVVRMHDRPKTSATIARLMNRDDIPNIQYSLRKLEAAGLVIKRRDKASRQFIYAVTPLGEKLTDRYAKVRADVLLDRLKNIDGLGERLEKMAQEMALLTSFYDDAARDCSILDISASS